MSSPAHQSSLDPTAAACPFHGKAVSAGLQRRDVLALPMHKRVVTQYAVNESGQRELRLFYGHQEISFDEPDMFAFGEALGKQSRFRALDAMSWGEGYTWDRVSELLSQLIGAGILRVLTADDEDSDPAARDDVGDRPSPLPPAPNTTPRHWDDAQALMSELTGHPLDPAYLELVIPIFRVAHMAVDADARQVGEANVFPPAMRLPVATRWRTCIYAGTRHHADRPMNVTALKAMRAHWGTMMLLLLNMRRTYLRRFPQAEQGWTVGHLERLSTAVLALPSLLLLRAQHRVANGALHPALSSVFRVTDGLRMAMHQMLFVPLGEPTLSPDAPMSSAEVLAYAERNYSFYSDHGVCAGPQAMIEEFLAVLIDGKTPRDGLPVVIDDAIEDALQAVEPALDYGLMGLRAYGVVFSLWPAMTRAYQTLADGVQGLADSSHEGSAAHALSLRLQGHLRQLREATYLGQESWRHDREQVYADMVAQCERGLNIPSPEALQDRLAPVGEVGDDTAQSALLQALLHHLEPAGHKEQPPEALLALSHTLMDYLRLTRAVLREATRVQAPINALLGRAAPGRELTATDLDLHNRLQGHTARRVPYLPDELQALLGVRIVVTASQLTVTATESSGTVPPEQRAMVHASTQGNSR